MTPEPASNEQSILRVSLVAILLVSALGIGFGLWSGSNSIIFDGMFSLIDAAMTVLSMLVARLIVGYTQSDGLSPGLRRRFSLGFWHFEPMVVALNAGILLLVMIYAAANAVISLREGGRELAFGLAIGYAVVAVLVCFSLAWWEHRANRELRSEFVAIDVKGWVMAGSVSLALLIAFCIGKLLQGGPWDHLTRYIDPAVLLLVCVLLLPTPIGTLKKALGEIAFMTPPALKAEVDAVAERIVAEEGFSGHRAYVSRLGRSAQIELAFIVPPGLPARPLEDWDAIRDRIGAELDEANPHRWITIAFTTNPARA